MPPIKMGFFSSHWSVPWDAFSSICHTLKIYIFTCPANESEERIMTWNLQEVLTMYEGSQDLGPFW